MILVSHHALPEGFVSIVIDVEGVLLRTIHVVQSDCSHSNNEPKDIVEFDITLSGEDTYTIISRRLNTG